MHLSPDSSVSHPSATILMLIITIIAALLILLFALMFQLSWYDPRVPCIFEITKITHTNAAGVVIDDGRLSLMNTGTVAYENWNLYALTYVNGELVTADLPTLNADEYIQVVGRRGVETLGGTGSDGSKRRHNAFWYSGAIITIDYSIHLIHPGDQVTIEVYNKTSKEILSRDTFPHPNERVKWMMDQYFSRRGA